MQVIYQQEKTEKSRYFAIAEFNTCFMIRSRAFFFILNHSRKAQGRGVPFSTQERSSNFA